MPRLNVDAEQAALIQIALGVMDAVLSARLTRVDPDHIISDSLALQRAKVRNIDLQLRTRQTNDWLDYDETRQGQIDAAASAFHQAQTPEQRRQRFARLYTLVTDPAPPSMQPDLIDWLDPQHHPQTKPAQADRT